jgi:ferredoxin
MIVNLQGGALVQVTIDEARCCGAGQCVLAAPEVFDQREDDGVVILLDAEPPAGEAGNVREAAALCPAAVIAIQD